MGAETVEEGGRLGRVGVRVEERMVWRGRLGVVGSVMSSAARLDILSWSHDGRWDCGRRTPEAEEWCG